MLIRLKEKFVDYFINPICPFCNGNLRRLNPIGLSNSIIEELKIMGAGRRMAGCPNCGSNDRERLVFAYLKFIFQLFKRKNLNILHVAPEPNIFKILQNHKDHQYVAGDKRYDGYQYPPEVIDLDLTEIKFPNNSFDLIICNHVLEHIVDDLKAMRELFRVLKPGGTAILQVPYSLVLNRTLEDPSVTTPAEREKRFGQFDHVRVYGKDYVSRLSSCDFKVEKLNLSSKYSRYKVNSLEPLFVAHKEIT